MSLADCKHRKKIFLTGGTGFFGKSILSMMLRGWGSDISLTLLSRDPEAFLRMNPEFAALKNIEFIAGDVRNFTFPESEFSHIIHGAAPTVQLPGEEIKDIILNGTRRVIQMAEKCHAQRLLLISSGAVYGNTPETLKKINENTPCRPVTEYGIAKYEAEQMCLDCTTPTVIARCFTFVGEYLDINSHHAVSAFIKSCLNGKNIEITGTGKNLRSYMFADDLVTWLFTILFSGKNGEIYNTGSDHPVSIEELAKLVCSLLAPELSITIKGRKDLPQQAAFNYVPDIDKCRNTLGLELSTSLPDAIRKTAVSSIFTQGA